MAIYFGVQNEPQTDPQRGSIYEDDQDNHIKVKTSQGQICDVSEAIETSPFGAYWTKAERLAEHTTSSTSWVDHLEFNTPIVPAGDYILTFFYNWGCDSTSDNFNAEILLDGSNIMTHVEMATDSGSDQRAIASGQIPIVLSAGAHNFKMHFKASSGAWGSTTAKLYNTRMMFWRAQ